MRKNYLTMKSNAPKVFYAQDFRKLTKRSYNITSTEKELNATYGFLFKGKTVENIIKIFDLNGKLYLLKNDGSLYRYDFDTSSSNIIAQGVSKDVVLVEALKGGAIKTLIIDNSGAYFEGETQIFDMPLGDFATVFNGRVVTAKGKTVSFGNAFNFTDFSHSDLSGTVSVENGCGDIVGLGVLDRVLYVFCESAIFSLTADDETVFQFKKVPVIVNGIIKNSVHALSGAIVFMQRDGVYTFNKNNVVSVNGFLSKNQFEVVGKASSYGNIYTVAVTINGGAQTYIYMYDALSERETLIDRNVIMIADGRYLLNSTYQIYKILERDQSIIYCLWESEKLNMNVPYQKSLLELSIYLSEKATITLTGQFGSKNLWLKKGFNVIPLNLCSDTFSISMRAENKNFYASDLKLKYRVSGE